MNPAPRSFSFVDSLRPWVSSLSQRRGKLYFDSRSVTQVTVDGPQAYGVVDGNMRYDVRVIQSDEGECGFCSCPAFRDIGPCKHMWALALAADTKEAKGNVPASERSGARARGIELDPLQKILLKYGLLGLNTGRDTGREPGGRATRAVDPTDWKARLDRMEVLSRSDESVVWQRALLDAKRVEYVLDLRQSRIRDQPALQVFFRTRKKNGDFGVRKNLKLDAQRWADELGQEDLKIIEMLGAHTETTAYTPYGQYNYRGYEAQDTHEVVLSDHAAVELITVIAKTGRLLVADDGRFESMGSLAWDAGDAWCFRLRLEPGKVGRKHVATLSGDLVRGEEVMALEAPTILFSAGLLVEGGQVARLDPRGAMQWAKELRLHGPLVVPKAEATRLGENLAITAFEAWERSDDAAAEGGVAEQLDGVEISKERPTEPPTVALEISAKPATYRDLLPCTLKVTYRFEGTGGPVTVDPMDSAGIVPRADGQGWIQRDLDFEVAALTQLHRMASVTAGSVHTQQHALVQARNVPKVVEQALAAGWEVKAEGKLYRTDGVFSASVASGVDWFDLDAGLGFGEEVAPLPAILEAARNGRRFVKLGDGSFGVLPDNWLQSWGLLELAGKAKGDSLRFQANQGWILDALLAGREGVRGDAGFAGYRERLERFAGVKPVKERRSFQGELRPYQRLAVGWFHFLRELGLGGCLADDMGLGKTVQVLALLEERRFEQKKLDGGPRPTLVVAPNSLVFNWLAEAKRFAPKLRTLDYTGPDRASAGGDLTQTDLVVTTYGTLRRDAVQLADVEFDYVVLDEATAIKNASSQTAKAARLMNGRHRLALSGTPIENHLGELWSLFEFLNPGMLGASTAFQRFAKAGRSAEDLDALSRSLAPFFLRRTKREVLKDLPEKTEQVILCELGKAERTRYDEVRSHFRAELLGSDGPSDDISGDQKLQVLEALLRLRQCACHPALMDESLMGEPSAKLDELLPRLEQLAEKGHKVLVFSQFTSFLKVVRARLDQLGLVYEYLDGKTRKRQEKVERFQTDDACKLFLISIKAGGHGLNLTAADYVFIMDPWWNPAIEAQAVDRAHRMGQVKPVFAYRLIAKDTVEEKVLELQSGKRELAAAVIGEGASVLRSMTRSDLEQLLS